VRHQTGIFVIGVAIFMIGGRSLSALPASGDACAFLSQTLAQQVLAKP